MRAIQRLLTIDPRELLLPWPSLWPCLPLDTLFRRLFLRALRAWSERTANRPARILTDSLRGPTMIWAIILAAHLALESSSLPA